MRQHRWVELLNHYACAIKYHPGKANVVVDALNRKETKPRRVRALQLTIHSNLPGHIRIAQVETLKTENLPAESLRGMEKRLELKDDGIRYVAGCIWIPSYGNLRQLVMNKAHKSRYSIHPGADKMYHDLKILYWWPNMKVLIAKYVSKFQANKEREDYLSGLFEYRRADYEDFNGPSSYYPYDNPPPPHFQEYYYEPELPHFSSYREVYDDYYNEYPQPAYEEPQDSINLMPS
ncbi:uncharacterized protein LOC118486339 [Helianthus annuus]|uniref:uncharacterized protein LOC118486339 n=1 Tax=Helianthus annuus TaxID=4232 RepID=UPI0016532C33|nr:uncharacterized protein LOC118486339 [Helianthus annuus]